MVALPQQGSLFAQECLSSPFEKGGFVFRLTLYAEFPNDIVHPRLVATPSRI